jgi:NCS1 family nucleobase:cation symporter-1
MSFFTGFGISALIYILLNILFPVPGSSIKEKFWEVDLSDVTREPGKDSYRRAAAPEDGTSSVSSDGKNGSVSVVVQEA